MTDAVPATTGFPSPQFEQKISELRAAIVNDRSELETAQKKLGAMASNRDALTAIGKDAEVEIRNAKAGIAALERRISTTRSQIVQLFRDEHKSLDQHRSETWNTVYTKFVDPTAKVIITAAQLLNAKMREVVALSKSQPADFSTLLEDFKASEDRWNELVRDFGGLGIGGNLVAEFDLCANVAHALSKVIREHFGPTSAIAEALALFTVVPWKEAPPTLAERVEARRKELQRIGKFFDP